MPFSWKYRIQKTMPIAAFIVTWGFMAGCVLAPEPAPAPAPCPPDLSTELKQDNAVLRQKLATSEKDLAASKAQLIELNNLIAHANLRLIELESLTNNLQHRGESQEQRLEAAIVEVVRTKAKLRSIESKAEAASTLAEAEIAVKELKGQLSVLDKAGAEEVVAVEQLLNMSVVAFKEQNYGGALYLANQAKTRVRAIRRLDKKIPKGAVVQGETPFSQPLTLKVLKKSNVRQGPGLTEKIIAVLDQGVLVTGYGYLYSWVRVETQEGVVGWIFQELIAAP